MVGRFFALSLAAFGAAIALAGAERPYFPPQDSWERRDPAAMGLDAAKLAEAVAFAKTNESAHPRDFSNQERVFGRPLGPLPAIRGRTKGLIVYRGYIVAEWGDTTAVEPTFSAAKSFLSTLAGVASDRGLIRVDEPVARTVRDGGYDSAHNGQVTWAHHLWQTSEWEGELWGKPHTFLGEAEFGQGRRQTRELKEPGSHYEYNDVRINRLALSLLRVFGKPLPEVLREAVMDPIGASGDWRYLGYENSFVELGGRRMQSVTGGTRWGGGLWIGAEDQARFGLLFLRGGEWNGKRIVSKEWMKLALAPSPQKADYGFLWWLNPGRRAWPALSEKSFAAVGYGSNTIWVDPARDLVVVWRWHAGNGSELLRRVAAAMGSR
jgi:CubicO group peptidase (beta-lactamase class C family)